MGGGAVCHKGNLYLSLRFGLNGTFFLAERQREGEKGELSVLLLSIA